MSASAHVRRADEGGVAVLTLDTPGRRVNTLTDRTFAELLGHARDVAGDGTVAGALLVSGKPGTFCTGADVDRLPELRAATDPLPALEQAHEAIMALASSRKPFVAAVDGAALGGGLELALACHERIASDTDATRFALPEVRLGLLPGAGGTQHLPRVLPLPLALEHLLTGKTMYVARARATGLLDDAVPANQLRRAALARVHALAASGPACWTPRAEPPSGTALDDVLAGARTLARQASRGLYPAPEAILDVVAAGLHGGVDAGLRAEREAFVRLLRTPQSAAALHLFTASEEAKRRAAEAVRRAGAARDRSGAPVPGPVPGGVRKVFVLGGGTMGAGIAAVAVDHGIAARVRDVDERALARVHRYTDEALRRAYAKRRSAFDVLYRARYHRLSTTTRLDGIGSADVVVEAVVEDASLKARVLAEAEARMRPGAVLASNTSALPIARLAEACRDPGRVVGMHFFSPAERMPLVEVVPHAGTDEQALATALGLARQLGKTPITVADAPGFYTSRVFGRWLAESVRLLLEGVGVEDIDTAAEGLGFAVGPLKAYDEVSLTLAAKVSADVEVADVTGRALDTAPVRAAIASLLEAGHAGRQSGLGFYHYAGGERQGPAAEVYAVLGVRPAAGADTELVRDRLLYAFVREAFACLDDGLLARAADGDVGAVLGIGFPPNLGGPFHHTDAAGAGAVVERLEALDERAGGFAVPSTLRRLAEGGGSTSDIAAPRANPAGERAGKVP